MMSFTTCVLLILSYPVLSIFPRAMSKVFQLFSFCNRTKSKQITTFNPHSLMRQLRLEALLNFLHSQGFGSIIPCKGVGIPESGKFFLVESGILDFGIQKKLKESGIKECGIMYLESGIHGVESRIQDFKFPDKWRNLWDISQGNTTCNGI